MNKESYFGEKFYSIEDNESAYTQVNESFKKTKPIYETFNTVNTISGNKVNNLFFSFENKSNIHNQLINSVKEKTDYTIGKQSDEQLQIIMRSIYLQHSKNLNYDIEKQVDNLNKRVLNYCIPQITGEIQQYIGYLKDINEMPVPMARSQDTSIKGNKVVERTRFI